MVGFDNYAKMSQFGSLWRAFTCGQLENLLNDRLPDEQPSADDSSACGTGDARNRSSAILLLRRRGVLEEVAGDDAADFHESDIRRLAWRLPRRTCSFRSRGWCGSTSAAAAAARPRRRSAESPAISRPCRQTHLRRPAEAAARRSSGRSSASTFRRPGTCSRNVGRASWRRPRNRLWRRSCRRRRPNGQSFTPPNLGGLSEQDLEHINFH